MPRWSTSRSDRKRTSRHASLSSLECLEHRTCLSTTVSLVGNTLNILGDNAANSVNIVVRDRYNDVKVVADNATYHFSSLQVKNMNINLKGGDDNLSMQLGASTDTSAPMFDPKNIVANLGDGNDEAQFWFGGLGFPGRTISTNLNITVNAGNGNDDVIGNFGEQQHGAVNFNAYLGAGDDTGFAGLWGTVDYGAAVHFNIQGQDGNDSINSFETYNTSYNAYDHDNIGAGALLDINLSGGNGNDHLGMTYGGQVFGKLQVRMDGGSGNDSLSGDYYIQAPSPGAVDIVLQGGDGRDGLALNLHGQSSTLRALIDGGGGFDRATSTGNVQIINANELIIPIVPGGGLIAI